LDCLYPPDPILFLFLADISTSYEKTRYTLFIPYFLLHESRF
ncbi:MAG: hypothetical protein RL422_1686, partial [Bacteroidota bacterium]